jgi:hypothetical protein
LIFFKIYTIINSNKSLYIKNDKKKTTLHHIIPTSRWWEPTRNSKNTISLDIKTHTWLHKVFWNAFPNEQLIEILENPKNEIKNSKKEDLYKLLWISTFQEIYFPELITNLDDFYKKELRVWLIKNTNKIKNFQQNFFIKDKTTEDKLLKLYKINEQVLAEKFKKQLLNIIN